MRHAMADKPLPVVVCAIIQNFKILLLKRNSGDYQGLWALPGGKIELTEHVKEAALREVREEVGIECQFISFLGIVSEHLMEANVVTSHLLLHVCELEPLSNVITKNVAGEARWFDLSKLDSLKDEIIPSDLLMIQRMLIDNEGTYYDCVIEKHGAVHVLQKFENLSATRFK
jgi:8-oxo-dGTP diphosphatase